MFGIVSRLCGDKRACPTFGRKVWLSIVEKKRDLSTQITSERLVSNQM